MNQETPPGRAGFGKYTVADKSHHGLDYCICAACNPAIKSLCMEGSEYFASFVVPAECAKCSSDPMYFPDECQTWLRFFVDMFLMRVLSGMCMLGTCGVIGRRMHDHGSVLREHIRIADRNDAWQRLIDPWSALISWILSFFTEVVTEAFEDKRLTVDKWDALSWMQSVVRGTYDQFCANLSELFSIAKVEFTAATDYKTLYFFFTGQRSRVCVSDHAFVPASAGTCRHQFLAKTEVFLIPANFCFYLAVISAFLIACVFYSRRTRNRKMVLCRMGITERYFQNLHNYSSLKMSDPKRDISAPIVNTLDATKGVPGEIQTVLFYVLGGMSIRVPPTFGFFGGLTDVHQMMRGVNSNMRSTQFIRGPKSSTSGKASTSPGAPPGLARLKTIWDRIDRFGHYGYQVYLKGPRTILSSLVKEGKLPLDLTAESAMVMQGAEPMPDARPPPGVTPGFVANPNVTSPGPMLEPSTIHDPAGVSHSTESRTMPSALPDGSFRRFNPRSDVGRRFMNWAQALYKLFTDDFIDRAFLKNYEEVQLGEVPCGAFSKEEMQRFVSSAQILNGADSLPTRCSGGKRETIPKDCKDIRSVVDNTGEVFAIMNAAGKTMETMLFDEEIGIFRHMCIKHRPRPRIITEVQDRMARPNCLAWEIDQTKMEAHVRNPGSLKVVINLLEKVMKRVRHRYSAQLTHQYDIRIAYDEKNGMRLKMSVNSVCLPGCEKKVTLVFEDMFLDSGWLLTSGGNFILETGATTACSVANPEHMFCKDKDGNVRISEGTFNHLYRGLSYKVARRNAKGEVVPDSPVDTGAGALTPEDRLEEAIQDHLVGKRGKSRPKPKERDRWVQPAKPVVFEGRFEGDDGAGQISDHIGDPAETDEQKRFDGFAEQIRENMADLGFDAKFKIIRKGRLEFVGLHATVENGAVSAAAPIIPAIKRSLGKLGANPQPNGRTTEQLAAIDAMRFYSLAEMYKGRVPAMHKLFTNCAERNARQVGAKARKETLKWNEYSDVGKAFGVQPDELYNGIEIFDGPKGYSLEDVIKLTREKTEDEGYTPSAGDQLLALATSLELDTVDPAALAQLDILAQDCSNDVIDNLSCYLQLPACMRAEATT